MRLQPHLQRFRNQFTTQRRNERARINRPLLLEQLEDRTTPSVLFTPHPAENATSGGGSIMGTASWGVPIYTIFWGSYWGTTAGQNYAAQLEGAINSMFYNSAYLDGLQQYGTSYRAGVPGSGTVEVFNYSDPSSGFAQSTFQNVVQNAIDNQGLPEPDDYSNEGIYVVFTTPGVYTSGDSGYHTTDTDYDFPFDFDTIHEAWVGTDGTLDGTTPTLSHEIAETMSDPNGDAWQVDPRNSSSWNEIGDNEAQNYSYRLNGYLVQSLWSQEDGAYEVEDGNTQNMWINNGVLSIYGDQFGVNYNDSISLDENGSGGVYVNMNGEVFSFDPGQITSINVYAEGGNNTINIYNNNVPINVQGASDDTVNIGNGSIGVQGILATINVENPPSLNTINVNDSADATARTTYLGTFTPSGDSNWGYISGLAPANINYEYADTASVTVTTGSASGNVVNVLATGDMTNLVSNRSTTVNVGKAGSVQSIVGTLNIENPPSLDTINIDNSADGTARTTTLGTFTPFGDSNWGYVSGLAQANINYEYADTTSVTVRTGFASGNVINVLATGDTTNLISRASTTVNIGNAGSVQGIFGTLNIENPPSFDKIVVDDSTDATARATTLSTGTNSSDSEGNGHLYGFITGLAPAAISYEYFDTTSVSVNTGTASGNVVNVLATGVTTNLRGHASTTVNVGNAGSAQGIVGTLNIENPPSFTAIVVDDSAHNTSAATTVTLSTLGTNSSDSQGNTDRWGQVLGLTPAPINYEYFDTSSLTINGGGGTGAHTWNILATGDSTAINGGSSSDTFNVGSGGAASTLNDLQGALTVHGGLGTNTLNVNDQGAAGDTFTLSATVLSRVLPSSATISYGTITTLNLNAGGSDKLSVLSPVPTITVNFNAAVGTNTLVGASVANTWVINGANHGTLGKVVFSNVQNLVGGAAGDTFKFSGVTPSIAGIIAGGGGSSDKLDYSLYTGGAISVNLQTSAASLIHGGLAGGFAGIFALAGTSASDTLTGPNSATIFNNWSITGPNAGKVVYGSPAKTFTFTGIEKLVGGTGVDVFKFTAAGTAASINGNGAPAHQGDWLDYSGVASAVTVNLATSQARIGAGPIVAISNIQNIHGGNGGNTLTGNSKGNILIGGTGADTINGGTGRSLLIGDTGSDHVRGGSGAVATGGDILVGGTTIWDNDTNAHLASLMAVFAEWQNTAHTFAQRVNFLRVGGGLNGTNKLTWGTTVNDDGVADTLTAATAGSSTPAVDWFFIGLLDTAVNTEKGEGDNNGTF
jgi:hypothetical protein